MGLVVTATRDEDFAVGNAPTNQFDRSVLVVGAGVTGASIAYHAASRGLAVTLIDQGLPGMGATQHSFGWIGRSIDSGPSAELRRLARDDFLRLEREIPTISINWCGALTWGDYFACSGDAPLRNPLHVEPQLISAPDNVRFGSHDGSVEPVMLAESLVEAARQHGAKVIVGQPAVRLLRTNDVVVGARTPTQTLNATHTVVAAGTDSAQLCASVGVHLPVYGSPAVMVRLRTRPGLVRHIVANDSIEVRQLSDGTLLVPLDYCGQTTQGDLTDTAEKAREEILRTFEVSASVDILGAAVGWRPMPADDEPVIGPVPGIPGLYVAVVHPGITLAATVGRLVAHELADSTSEVEQFARCRMTRFA
ncbi:FAD-binding oxidoreductase [Mycolicibacterium boenickei]|nr:FAD-binding oxidoreductase [Mycolicibacterium boenickei]